MKRSRYTEAVFARMLEMHRSGADIADICANQGISISTFYSWRSRFSQGHSTDLPQLLRLRKENQRLRLHIERLTEENDKLKGIVRSYKRLIGSSDRE